MRHFQEKFLAQRHFHVCSNLHRAVCRETQVIFAVYQISAVSHSVNACTQPPVLFPSNKKKRWSAKETKPSSNHHQQWGAGCHGALFQKWCCKVRLWLREKACPRPWLCKDADQADREASSCQPWTDVHWQYKEAGTIEEGPR